jgi:hypothetical protein
MKLGLGISLSTAKTNLCLAYSLRSEHLPLLTSDLNSKLCTVINDDVHQSGFEYSAAV